MRRRTFLQHAGALAGTAALGQLGAFAAHAAASNDYKALVCIFLYGGNDANNMIVPLPTDGTFAAYTTGRGALALPADYPTHNGGNTALNGSTSDGRTWGLHPSMQELANLFNSGKA